MSLTIDGIRLDDPQHVYVIAEASANHCRDLGKARALVEAAHAAGAQACKFQTFSADRIAAPNIVIPRGFNPAHDAWLDRIGAVTVQDVLSQGGLPWEWHEELQALAASLGISFLSTPFSLEDAKFLVEEIKVPGIKIASGDITFLPLLAYAGGTGLPIILSTGASSPLEIKQALELLGMKDGYAERVALLHCVSIYPCPIHAINLQRLREFSNDEERSTRICGTYGLSDHTLSVTTVPAMAVALGATVYEKHLRLDEGTSVDTDHSLTPSQFKAMVATLRDASLAMGGEWPTVMPPAEAHERLWMRRSPEDWKRPTLAAQKEHGSEYPCRIGSTSKGRRHALPRQSPPPHPWPADAALAPRSFVLHPLGSTHHCRHAAHRGEPRHLGSLRPARLSAHGPAL